ncbi:MAG: ATP-binding protein [Eubacteriales bacterium]|nr:ATP-binding protein [Eubacteriales bacterium]
MSEERKRFWKNPILLRFSLVLILALAISSVISSLLLSGQMLRQNIEVMEQTIAVADYALNYESPLQEQLEGLHSAVLQGDMRITLIGRDGTVLADTDMSDEQRLSNHLNRREVQKARQSGQGYAIRYSESLGEYMLYVAALAKDGNTVIRLSIPYAHLLSYMLIVFPILLVGMLVAFAVSVAVAAKFTGYIRSDEVKRQMVQMERDKRIRQEFFSNASHELKTPITSVRGYAELLSQDFAQDEATRKDFLSRILKETEHMTGLIDDILLISRLESKDAEVTLSKVQLCTVMNEVLESLAPQAAACQVEISGECSGVCLQASLQQMRELLLNLISNGIKYNHPGGHVRTRIWQGAEAVMIEVKDDGVGIAPEDQKRVFERFFRVDKGRSRKMGGTGLGLAIVKHITAYYGGSVSLTSEMGAGSTFLVEIPLSGINKV